MARIFVVDDEPTLRSVIARIVAMDHHDVEEFADGREALEAAERDAPDLIITDIFMPGMTGVELLIQLDRIAPQVPVIAISAGGDGSGPPPLDEAIHLGAAATIGKPFRAEEVRRTVERVLASSAAGRGESGSAEGGAAQNALEAEVLAAAILLVTGDDAVRDDLTGTLERHGFTGVRPVATGPEALDVVASSEPDLVVLDAAADAGSASDAGALMAQMRESSNASVLALVDDREHRLDPAGLEAGALDHVVKPPTAHEIIARVRNLITTRVLQRRLTSQKEDLEIRVGKRTRDVELAHWEVVDRLATVAEYRDDLTGAHQRRVGEMAAVIGRRLGMDELLVRRLRMAAPLHDIGKVAIPDAILRKPAPLDHDEWKVMRTHTTVGARMLTGGDFPLLRTAERIALTHHERWDGVGYPEGLKGDEIPVEGRITAIADVIDCMTHPRPYRDALPASEAIAEVERCSGTQFDPGIVPVVLEAWDEGELQRVLDIDDPTE